MGRWVVLAGGELYEKSNHSLFFSALDSSVEIVLVGSDKHKDALRSFYCDTCKKRKRECTCKVVPEQPVEEKCPRCGIRLQDCICHRDQEMKVEKVKLERAAGDLLVKAQENEVEKFGSVLLRAGDREALTKLLMALPQFGKVEMKFNLGFTINMRPQGGNNLTLKYEGNRAGVDAIKSVLVNYEAKQPLSSHDLLVEINYPEGIMAKEFCDLLGNKVGQFTAEALFTVTVRPKEEAQ